MPLFRKAHSSSSSRFKLRVPPPAHYLVVWEARIYGPDPQSAADRGLHMLSCSSSSIPSFNVLDSEGTWWFWHCGTVTQECIFPEDLPPPGEYQVRSKTLVKAPTVAEAAEHLWRVQIGERAGKPTVLFEMTDSAGQTREVRVTHPDVPPDCPIN